MRKNGFLIITVFCFGCISCTKQLPQLPSNKFVDDNSDAKTMLVINQSLAIKEDSLLEIYAKKKDKALIKNELGFWYKIEQSGKGLKVKDKSTCKFSYRLTKLDGKIIEKDRKQVIIGKKLIVTGLEEGIKLLHHGDSATFIIPWYLGYGMKGNKPFIPPYTSIIYEIKLDN